MEEITHYKKGGPRTTRILIADDIPVNLYLLESILKGNGFSVIPVKNGAEALEAARKDRPDLIITDIMMPKMDGFELCRRIRADMSTSRIPVIFYTSTYTEPRHEEFSKNLGVDRFVIKPQKPDELVRIVREVLEQSAEGRLPAAEKPPEDEMELLRQYNEVLFHKLERKMTQLEGEVAERKAAEEKLRQLNEELETRVTERTAQLDKSLAEKELLLKEIHHRVKNNLQIVASLLHSQARHISDPAVIAMLEESQNRVKAMALVHEKLYQAKNLGVINAAEYITSLVTDLKNSYTLAAGIEVTVEVDDVSMNLDMAIPCGLIVNELVTNSLKYAFAGREGGTIAVELRHRPDHTFLLVVSDDGAGLPADFTTRSRSSLGMQLVSVLVRQLGGTLESASDQGARFTIVFPEKF